MAEESLIVQPARAPRTVRTADGQLVPVPTDWELLPPGDAALTRRVKALGPTWTVQELKGRKVFSRGVWAPAARIAAVRAELAAERAEPAHAAKMAADRRRRERKEQAYALDFARAVEAFLDFAPRHAEVARVVADAVAAHATPVGSGTVARTERIPLIERAEAAVIAWMRHQTTAYDTMAVPRVKGARRGVRARLAAESRSVLTPYRRGDDPPTDCPLGRVIASIQRKD